MFFFVTTSAPLILLFLIANRAKDLRLRQETRVCPWCCETVPIDATICRACRERLRRKHREPAMNPWLRAILEAVSTLVVGAGGLALLLFVFTRYLQQR